MAFPGQSKPSVLVVDDDPLVRRLLEDCFVTFGYGVVAAADADAARAVLETGPLDLAVIDAVLPRESGVSLAAAVAGRGIPVIVISGNLDYVHNVDDLPWPHLRKPFRLDELQRLAESLSLRKPR